MAKAMVSWCGEYGKRLIYTIILFGFKMVEVIHSYRGVYPFGLKK
jgi:hypothetical protein